MKLKILFKLKKNLDQIIGGLKCLINYFYLQYMGIMRDHYMICYNKVMV